ncbi:MAG TPA: lipid II flippase MurJ, partial [Leptolinea sp.]
YALHDTRTPVIIGVLAMSLNILFSLVFSSLFSRAGLMPHGGLALANSLATALEMMILLFLMRRRLHGLKGFSILDALWKGGAACLTMGMALYFWIVYSASRPVWIITLIGIVIGVGVYGSVLLLVRVNEIGILWRAIRRRFLHKTP